MSEGSFITLSNNMTANHVWNITSVQRSNLITKLDIEKFIGWERFGEVIVEFGAKQFNTWLLKCNVLNCWNNLLWISSTKDPHCLKHHGMVQVMWHLNDLSLFQKNKVSLLLLAKEWKDYQLLSAFVTTGFSKILSEV